MLIGSITACISSCFLSPHLPALLQDLPALYFRKNNSADQCCVAGLVKQSVTVLQPRQVFFFTAVKRKVERRSDSERWDAWFSVMQFSVLRVQTERLPKKQH